MIIREQSNRIAAYSEKAKCSRLQLLHHAIIRPGEPACEGRLLYSLFFIVFGGIGDAGVGEGFAAFDACAAAAAMARASLVA